MSEGDLEEYLRKRDFDSTPEPMGEEQVDWDDLPRFVIQKHDASSLHYDFRLEANGVLKSWAIPKGPSTDPAEKRLAVPTEDHPLDYIDFEGAIPEDEYGGGAVLVWDAGRYRNQTTGDDAEEVPVTDAIEDGHVVVWLEGEKLTGGYALTRTGSGDDARWLLVKMDDDRADARRNPTSTEPESVLTERDLDDITEQESPK